MLTSIFAGLIAATLIIIGVAFVFKRFYAKEKQKIVDLWSEATRQPAPDKNSLLAEYIDEIAQIFILRFENRIKAQTMQAQGAVKRQANQIEAEMTKNYIARKVPLLGAIMELAPESAGISKLLKTPSAGMAVAGLVEKFMGSGGGGGGNNGHSKESEYSSLYT